MERQLALPFDLDDELSLSCTSAASSTCSATESHAKGGMSGNLADQSSCERCGAKGSIMISKRSAPFLHGAHRQRASCGLVAFWASARALESFMRHAMATLKDLVSAMFLVTSMIAAWTARLTSAALHSSVLLARDWRIEVVGMVARGRAF